MDKEFTNGPMVENTKENTWTTKNKATEFIHIPMAVLIKVNGLMENSTVKVYLLHLKVIKEEEHGKMERGSTG
jgi:hypothetical protein